MNPIEIKNASNRFKEMYDLEHAVALELAKHVSTLLEQINKYKTEPKTIYNAAIMRVSKNQHNKERNNHASKI
jgi:hypothetical protein